MIKGFGRRSFEREGERAERASELRRELLAIVRHILSSPIPISSLRQFQVSAHPPSLSLRKMKEREFFAITCFDTDLEVLEVI